MENLMLKRLKDSLDFFGELKNDDQERLTQSVVVKSFKKGQLIVAHTCEYICMYIVLKGCMRAIVEGESGKTITLKKFNKQRSCIVALGKSYLGFEVGINLIADEDCEIAIPSSFLINLLFNNYTVVKDFVVKNAVALLSGAVDVLQQITNRDMLSKLSVWLVDKCCNAVNSSGGKGGCDSKNGSASKSQFCAQIVITHEEIAQELGSVREVVSRNLKKLQQKGIVQLSRGSIAIIDMDKLEEIANI